MHFPNVQETGNSMSENIDIKIISDSMPPHPPEGLNRGAIILNTFR